MKLRPDRAEPVRVLHVICDLRGAARWQGMDDITSTEALLAELRNSRTDMWRWVKAASESQSPRVVIPAEAIRAWQQREPETWAKVAAWLATHGKRVVEI